MPTIQASAASTFTLVGPPSTSARTALITMVTGWLFANVCRAPGIVATGTNADDANTKMAMIGNYAACAASAFGVLNPMNEKTHDNEYANIRTSNSAPMRPKTLVWQRKPTM